jgi:hypothetical protein
VQGELVRLGYRIAASTVWQIMHAGGIGPAPRRTGPTWKQFLTAQARGVLAADFVHVDTVLHRRIYALIVIEHGTRRVHLAGITANPHGMWTTQAVRAENLVHGSDQQGCSPGRSAVRITDHVPAVPVPPDHAGRRVAAAVAA